MKRKSKKEEDSSSESEQDSSSSSSYYSSSDDEQEVKKRKSEQNAPQQMPIPTVGGHEDEDEEDDYGPTIPNNFQNNNNTGQPQPIIQNNTNQDDDEEDEDYGPMIPTSLPNNEPLPSDQNLDSIASVYPMSETKLEPTQNLKFEHTASTALGKSQKLSKEEKVDQLHLQQLPEGLMYEWSYMHRDHVCFVLVAPPAKATAIGSSQSSCFFIITMSRDGHVKFWRKTMDNIEFVKHFVAHKTSVMGPLTYGTMSSDGLLCASMSRYDLKIYDVTNFDMINVFSFAKDVTSTGAASSSLNDATSSKRQLHMCCFVSKKQGSAKDTLLGVYFEDGAIEFYDPIDPDSSMKPPVYKYNVSGSVMIHRSSVTCCKYNSVFGVMISCDEKGMVEYWNPHTGKFPTLEESSSYMNLAKGHSSNLFTFKYKSETSLFELAKAKTYAISIDISEDGKKFAVLCRDGHIRVFNFLSGKLIKDYDETLQFQENLQKAATNPNFIRHLEEAATSSPESSQFPSDEITKSKDLLTKVRQETNDIEMYALENFDFGRRVAIEHEIEQLIDSKHSSNKQTANASLRDYHATPNILFDESSSFIIYPTIFGIKIRNLRTDHVERLLGKVESTERFLHIGLFQAIIKMSRAELSKINNAKKSEGSAVSQIFTMSDSGDDTSGPKLEYFDPTLFCSAYKKNRFYLFTKREPSEDEELTSSVHKRYAYITSSVTFGRDIFNEKPSKEEMEIANAIGEASSSVASKQKVGKMAKIATIHTSFGDIQVRLFPDVCPKAVENFTQLSLNGYYDGCIFHRVIKNFMIQTGDNDNRDGTGGTSIFGKEFEDEFSPSLRHDRPGKLSMANCGPNTNSSQFFITTVPTPWLDDKHTLFGEVIKGMEVAHSIENVPTDENDRPIVKNVNAPNMQNKRQKKNLLDIVISNIDIDEFL
ncbi:hypothetical protein C9374_010363 [Naegleria lovaniensis]|uniref:peptidylprolyl isomerase n=1 Tax=Naegleria lovaniensis TaxID=51637 RepID=A0AA88KG34_NAELO|nr:uncharacterized protein C9374_010363 [Naegleria lovaniensis]KAG2374989.1 hypothetical protein C9374_010363 [Naegleria lovaniensis]